MVTQTKQRKTKNIEYFFHTGQQRVWDSKARFVGMLAGTQSGKTCFGPLWLEREIRSTARDGEDNDYMAVTANYDLYKLKMFPALRDYFVFDLGIGKYWAGDRIIELAINLEPGNFRAKSATDPMWGRVILRSAEAPSGLESATIKAAWLDEAGEPSFERIVWEAIQRRLSLSGGRVLFTTTLYDWNWFKIEIFDRWMAGDHDYDVIQFDSTVNPAFPRTEYQRAERTLPRWKFNLFYRGRYERPAGLIYDSFNEQTNKLTRREIDSRIKPDWPRYVGPDFGPIHNSALWYAQEPKTGYLYLYRTYLSFEKMTAASHVAKWQELTGKEPIRRRVGGAVSAADDGWREVYALAGWPINEPLVKSVEVGIDKVYGWHKTNRLYVADDLLDYLSEKLSYSRVLDEFYNPTDEIKDKSRYHLMDGERSILSDFQPVDTVKKDDDDRIMVWSPDQIQRNRVTLR